jgi:hypothetical protein
MKGCLGGCLGRLAALVILAGIIGAAWQFGPDLYDDVRGAPEPPEDALVASQSLSDDAEARLVSLLDGTREEISLAGIELESLLRFRFAEAWPEGIAAPTVRLRDDELQLGVRISRDRLPSLPELETILSFLPDTVPVTLHGRVLALSGGDAALLVHRIEAASVPIPRRFFPAILERVQSGRRSDLPPEALHLPLPEAIGSARVEGDRLVLTRPR